ncbi:hypothetical protein AAW14_27320 [Streptomyces hygroscopicus]|uniref:hypothetical protein n=1 Tax=Streptomyces hygroscopicus TaxID=1912 RepID=UPI0022402626|nr:hypothetical protein [Streptomyces hygroscopicus]MCW7945617.1 hypothetical protein [Streptomyces hygroscopicus]
MPIDHDRLFKIVDDASRRKPLTLGDLNKDAVAVAQSITAEERGVAVCTGPDGGWGRASVGG